MDVKERTNVASSDVSRSRFFKGAGHLLTDGLPFVARRAKNGGPGRT